MTQASTVEQLHCMEQMNKDNQAKFPKKMTTYHQQNCIYP